MWFAAATVGLASLTSPPANAEPSLPKPGPKAETQAPKATAKLDTNAVIAEAVKAYKAGQYGPAAVMLAKELKENPDDGKLHYYLGLALKKQGMDTKALRELEMAVRLCPDDMIASFAQEKLENLNQPKPVAATAVAAQNKDWFGNITSGISNSIGSLLGQKSKAVTSSTDSSPPPPPAWPDFLGSAKKAISQGQEIVKKASRGEAYNNRRQDGPAEVMSMGEMLSLAERSHAMNLPDWASHADGVKVYPQAPEGSPAWDYWISRFKKSFQHLLMRHIDEEALDQIRGAAACIFSVDRQGNLRGQIYASTADPKLNKCLVESIRELNHSRILAFPSNSQVTGWNFQMTWNFGTLLTYLHFFHAKQKLIDEARAQAELELTRARILAEKEQEKAKRAKALKLALEKKRQFEKKLQAQMAAQVKTEVAGHVIGQSTVRELKAVALELKDLTPVKPPPGGFDGDPFAGITDDTIQSWPDLNH
jgi:tetratricopeptide (TPR) repeat protein